MSRRSSLDSLVVKEPDLATAMLIGFVAIGVMIAAGLPWRHLLVAVAPALFAALVLAIVEPYRLSRLLTFLHPGRDPQNKSYQITQSLIALGNGGWTGVGLGRGHAKWLFLPAAHTDFIFSIIGEEVGLRLLGVAGFVAIIWTAVIGGKLVFEHAAGVPAATMRAEMENRAAGHEHAPGDEHADSAPHRH